MKQKAIAFCITLMLLGGLSCDRLTAPPTTGGIDVALSLASGVALEDVRVTVQGPTTKTLTFGPTSGEAMSVSVAELPPGTYSVSVAGLMGGRVAQFGETSGIAVAVGSNRSASVDLSGFQPVVATLPDTVNVLHFNVSYSAVPHAKSYVVEWSKSAAMADAWSTVVTGTSTEITVAEEGQYYFAVRAANDAVTVEGLPSPTHPIFAMQVVSSVTVLPLSPSIVDGTTQQFTATARDQDNAIISNPTLYWSSSNHLAATTNQNGLVTAVGPGQTTITAVSKGTPGSATLTVTSLAASKLIFTTPPTNTTAGQTIAAIKVAIQNAKGEVATSDDATQVTLQIAANPASGALSGTATATVVDGVATFTNLSIDKSGTGYTLQATAASLTGATSAQFNIVPGVATTLAFVTQPTSGVAGASISPAIQVEVRDALGNRVTAARDAVTLEFVANPGTGTLSGAKTVNAVDGVASFSGIAVDKAAIGYTVRAVSGSLTPTATSSAFDIAAGPAAALTFANQPTTTSTDGIVTAQVSVRDAFGNLVTTPVQVTVSLGANPGTGTLAGTLTAPTSGGFIGFANLAIDKVGTGYTLVASSGNLPTATSTAFDITVGAPDHLEFVVGPTEAEPQGPIPEMQVAIVDAHGNQTAVDGEDVTIAVQINPTGATLSGTFTVQTNSGVAVFNDLSLDLAGSGYQLQAASPAVAPVAVSGAFSVALQFADISASDINTCGLSMTGSAYCWGFGGVGATGQGVGDAGDKSSPARVIGDRRFFAISVGYAHACAIQSSDSTAYCWGWNVNGQLGNGGGNAFEPTAVLDGHQFIAISAGTVHTCAIRAVDNLAFCWGQQDFGRLGNGATGAVSVPTPQQVQGGIAFSSISAGYDHSCGVRASDGAGYCWGRQGNYRLGNNLNADVAVVAPAAIVNGPAFREITAGQLHSCGVATDNRGYCWGNNLRGQLGVGDIAERQTPVEIVNSLRFANLGSAGGQRTSGVSETVSSHLIATLRSLSWAACSSRRSMLRRLVIVAAATLVA
jgi:hypothetical protein